MAQRILLGIDIGGTKIAGGVVEAETGKVLLSDRLPTLAVEGGPAVLARALGLAQSLLARASGVGVAQPTTIGVGAGGQIDPVTGVVLSATDVLPGWSGTRLKESFEQETGLPTTVDNDVNALAVGECLYGAGRGAENVVFLALGTGVGGALVLGGKLYHSRTGVSGELGHLLLYPDSPPYSAGTRGSLEQYVAGPALWERYRGFGGSVPEGDGEALVAEAKSDPESPAARTITGVGIDLGLGLVTLANIFGPDRFVIGGGLVGLGDLLLEPARQTLAQRALPAVRSTPIVATLLGTEASVIGAASLAHRD